MPFIKEPIEQWLTKRNELLENRNIKELLNGLLNQKLITVLLEISHINNESTYETLEKNVKHRLCKNLKDFELSIISTKDFENAQVTIGGVPLTEIKKESLESIYEKGLYFTGEILDVDADCGGYNLGFAWLTGMIAGKNIQKGDES